MKKTQIETLIQICKQAMAETAYQMDVLEAQPVLNRALWRKYQAQNMWNRKQIETLSQLL